MQLCSLRNTIIVGIARLAVEVASKGPSTSNFNSETYF